MRETKANTPCQRPKWCSWSPTGVRWETDLSLGFLADLDMCWGRKVKEQPFGNWLKIQGKCNAGSIGLVSQVGTSSHECRNLPGWGQIPAHHHHQNPSRLSWPDPPQVRPWHRHPHLCKTSPSCRHSHKAPRMGYWTPVRNWQCH